jgi:exodeoxyribonuclease VII small subunit
MAKKAQAAPASFEEAMKELEQILSEIESGRATLEESLAKYERGTFLLTHCRGVLGEAEKKIELLSKTADGSIQAAPLEELAG